LLAYDPDQIQLLYVTPHQWTPYFSEIQEKNIIQMDQRFWDYKHQIMEIPQLKPWQVLLYVKLIEGIMQTRPKAIYRWFFHRDKKLRKAMFWYNNIGKRVWFYEIYQFFTEIKFVPQPIKLLNWLTQQEPTNLSSRHKKPSRIN
jgi:anaerobic magnesium-protoporphyrin IX monomethyl ester cyclase